MVWPGIELWEIVIDSISFLLCVFVISCLVIRGVRIRKTKAAEALDGKGDFDQVLRGLVKQSRMTFQTVSEGFSREQEILKKLIKLQKYNENGKEDYERPALGSGEGGGRRNVSGEGYDRDGSSSFDKHAHILELAEKGHTIHDISRRMHIPLGEVELVIKLRGGRDPETGNRREKMSALIRSLDHERRMPLVGG